MSTLEGGFPILSPRFDRVASRWSSLVTVWTDFVGTREGFCDVRDARDRFERVWRGLMNFFLFFRRNRNRDFINRRRKILHKSSIVVLCTFKIVSNGSFNSLNSWSMCSTRNRKFNIFWNYWNREVEFGVERHWNIIDWKGWFILIKFYEPDLYIWVIEGIQV